MYSQSFQSKRANYARRNQLSTYTALEPVIFSQLSGFEPSFSGPLSLGIYIPFCVGVILIIARVFVLCSAETRRNKSDDSNKSS